MAAEDASVGVGRLLRLARGEGQPNVTVPLSTAARAAVEQVVRCPFRGAMQALALEARFNDLLLEFLRALGGAEADRAVVGCRLRSDLERIHSADRMLAECLDQPPTLAGLAKAVGLGESTLKRGFKQVFGTTVFERLRRRRMEEARALLESGACTVLEAALRVGYSNPSHFAAAFRRQFGANPKRFQLDGSGRILAGDGWKTGVSGGEVRSHA